MAEPEPTFFASAAELRAWLEANHDRADELWVGLYKKASGRPSVTWPEVVEETLCFGWIDGIRKGHGPDSYMNRITPRRAGSNWSAINVANVERLISEGRMRPAGLAAYERRDPARTAVYSFEMDEQPLSPEQEARFRADAAAWAWWESAPPSYRRAATHWVATAKQAATRERRLMQLISDSAAGRRVAPLTPPAARR
jgi:uncharacterized protein YdeI (YjbR/CyaY-like superfamily)